MQLESAREKRNKEKKTKEESYLFNAHLSLPRGHVLIRAHVVVQRTNVRYGDTSPVLPLPRLGDHPVH